MRAFWSLFIEALIWLRRDRIFVPVVFLGVGVTFMARLMTDFAFDDYLQTLFDFGLTGFRFVGGMVAILWGTRIIHDALAERSLDPRLASPTPRWVWYAARSSALSLALIGMGVIFTGLWQSHMHIGGLGWMSQGQFLSLALIVFEWVILANIAMMAAVFLGFVLSIFFTAAVWILGLLAPIFAASKPATLSAFQSTLLDALADLWNFQRFLIMENTSSASSLQDVSDLSLRLTWAVAVLAMVTIIGMWRFSERDLG
jgi:hypothetical protein